jgi:hypothetical protein
MNRQSKQYPDLFESEPFDLDHLHDLWSDSDADSCTSRRSHADGSTTRAVAMKSIVCTPDGRPDLVMIEVSVRSESGGYAPAQNVSRTLTALLEEVPLTTEAASGARSPGARRTRKGGRQ